MKHEGRGRSEAEDQEIRDGYCTGVSDVQLAARLRRTVEAVRTRARKLRLKRNIVTTRAPYEERHYRNL